MCQCFLRAFLYTIPLTPPFSQNLSACIQGFILNASIHSSPGPRIPFKNYLVYTWLNSTPACTERGCPSQDVGQAQGSGLWEGLDCHRRARSPQPPAPSWQKQEHMHPGTWGCCQHNLPTGIMAGGWEGTYRMKSGEILLSSNSSFQTQRFTICLTRQTTICPLPCTQLPPVQPRSPTHRPYETMGFQMQL